ncbi:MAG: universal stress protein [Hyphomicrobiaceae bacterium]
MTIFLVPVDDSDYARRALDYAISLAGKLAGPAKLHIVTSHDEAYVSERMMGHISVEKVQEILQKHSESILEPAVEAARKAGVDFETEVLIGHTAEAVAARAKSLGADAIIMGTRGMSAVSNLVMGSVATKVVHLAEVPVTLVK